MCRNYLPTKQFQSNTTLSTLQLVLALCCDLFCSRLLE
jgi:hypothetical protein